MNVYLTHRSLAGHMPFAGQSRRKLREATDISKWLGIAFIAAHVPLALAINQVPMLSTLHALLTLLVGLRFAISRGDIRKVAYIGAYITGAEVLWRMTGADILWEFGKYGTSLIFILALLRNGRFKMPLMPVLYFALLLPGIVPTIMNSFGLDAVRQTISFDLSGPFALMACAWFFSHITFTLPQFERVCFAIIAPSVAIGVVTLISTVTAENLVWGTQSNFTTSGGYGPNQVSGALGLGALMALLFLFKSRANLWSRIIMFVVMLFLAAQSALTFSRGGLYGAAGAAIIAILFLSREKRVRSNVLVVSAVTVLLATFVVLPRLDNYTGGALSHRFENTKTTGRTEIAESDLRMWDENPVFGVGVGMSYYRAGGWKVTHTEFTRLLAEHGTFGLAALILLLLAGLQSLRNAKPGGGKALSAAMITWSILFMLDKAMRLVAPSFTFGLAFATLQSGDENKRPAPRPNFAGGRGV